MYGQGQEFNENGLIYHDIFSSESLAINNFIDFFFLIKTRETIYWLV